MCKVQIFVYCDKIGIISHMVHHIKLHFTVYILHGMQSSHVDNKS